MSSNIGWRKRTCSKEKSRELSFNIELNSRSEIDKKQRSSLILIVTFDELDWICESSTLMIAFSLVVCASNSRRSTIRLTLNKRKIVATNRAVLLLNKSTWTFPVEKKTFGLSWSRWFSLRLLSTSSYPDCRLSPIGPDNRQRENNCRWSSTNKEPLQVFSKGFHSNSREFVELLTNSYVIGMLIFPLVLGNVKINISPRMIWSNWIDWWHQRELNRNQSNVSKQNIDQRRWMESMELFLISAFDVIS